jgi:cellulose synthase/poly-beta-1,6-N-acetylglucosamine synthase-like glycosyltransferase
LPLDNPFLMLLIEFLLLIYFVYVVAYTTVFSIGGLLYKIPKLDYSTKKNRIAVFIPAYKEDAVIIPVARQARYQSYPKEYYDVIVLADSLMKATLTELSLLDIRLHPVQFEKSTKVKSLLSGLNSFDQYDIAVILDADNVMDVDFLSKINAGFNYGWKAIQGQRTAKNKNTPLAILDGISEAIANHINRQGAIALGLSSPLIGSGMAFRFSMLKDVMNTMDSVGGFDKELQIRILENGTKIQYLKDAIVQDEKVDTKEVFENQRKRWVSSHYIYFKKFFARGILSLIKGNLSVFNIAILYNIQLPRLMNLGILSVLTFLAIVLRDHLALPFFYWPFLLIIYVASLLLAIPNTYYNKSLLAAILTVPAIFISMFLIHFKLKGANKKFIHTPHKQQ